MSLGQRGPLANTTLQELLLVVDLLHAQAHIPLPTLCFPALRQGLSHLLPWALQALCPLPGSPEQTGSLGCSPGSQHLMSLFLSSIKFLSSVKRLGQALPALYVKDVKPSSTL